MAIRTAIDIPSFCTALRHHRTARSGIPVQALIIRALEETYSKKRKGAYVTGPACGDRL
jgi:hypothetical protein